MKKRYYGRVLYLIKIKIKNYSCSNFNKTLSELEK